MLAAWMLLTRVLQQPQQLQQQLLPQLQRRRPPQQQQHSQQQPPLVGPQQIPLLLLEPLLQEPLLLDQPDIDEARRGSIQEENSKL